MKVLTNVNVLKNAFWHGLIVEAALQAGCQILWSEDMQDGRQIGQLVIRNPFK